MMSETRHTIFTHNGFVTIENPGTGRHKTFKIQTKGPDAKFAPGRRVVYLVEGRGRGELTGFAFIGDGQLWLWKKYRGKKPWTQYAQMLADPERYEARARYEFDVRCRVCNRPLTDPESIRLGVGPNCRGDR